MNLLVNKFTDRTNTLVYYNEIVKMLVPMPTDSYAANDPGSIRWELSHNKNNSKNFPMPT